jgi:hypothetical protein
MDTSDPRIQFDDQGVCEYCNNFTDHHRTQLGYRRARGAAALARMADQIKVRYSKAKILTPLLA